MRLVFQILRLMKARFLSSKLKNHVNSPVGRIIVLTGARQTGKTTLAKNDFSKFTYLSIEDPMLRIQYKNLTASQWQTHYPQAILDEVQKEPSLIESIKSTYDQYEDVRYLLLGSSQLLLLKKVRETLAGRCIIEEVFPLTLPEILTQNWSDKIRKSWFQRFIETHKIQETMPSFQLDVNFAQRLQVFQDYIIFGGYPAIVNKEFSDENRVEWLRNYVRTYLERDLRDIAEIKSLEPFIKVQQMTALLTSQLVNYSKLANEADVTSKTAQRFLQYLEISYQTVMIQPWAKNKMKRLVKSPKLHYLDPGVQRAILQKRGDITGGEFESAVVAEIYKQIKVLGVEGQFYHLRTHDGAEIDLLFEMEEGVLAFEIKQTNRVTKKDARHLYRLESILNKKVLMSFVLSKDNQIYQYENNIMALPAAMFLT